MDFLDRAYLVLGAGGGTGAEGSRRLLAGGARVVLAGRAGDRLRALGEELGAPVVELDARQPAEVERAAAEAVGPLSGLANCVARCCSRPLTAQGWITVQVLGVDGGMGSVRPAVRR